MIESLFGVFRKLLSIVALAVLAFAQTSPLPAQQPSAPPPGIDDMHFPLLGAFHLLSLRAALVGEH
jgi:hypothetical protein